MQIIGKDQFDATQKKVEKQNQENEINVLEKDDVNKTNFKEMLEQMEHPVDMQKDLAVKIKMFLDKKIDDEMENDSILSESTRRWVKEFNDILDRIQKNLYGEKSFHVHAVRITHADIAAKIRKKKEEENA